jgi:hypothetical protein
MRILILMAVFAAFTPGCGTATHTARYAGPFNDGVDVAVNLGWEHAQDIDKLENAMALEGMPCRRRAMSLNAQQIVVERNEFDHAKALVIQIIVRKRLTVRVYKTPDFAKDPPSSMLEVWENGKKTREEPYRLY